MSKLLTVRGGQNPFSFWKHKSSFPAIGKIKKSATLVFFKKVFSFFNEKPFQRLINSQHSHLRLSWWHILYLSKSLSKMCYNLVIVNTQLMKADLKKKHSCNRKKLGCSIYCLGSQLKVLLPKIDKLKR